MNLGGLHHVTAVTSNAAGNLAFYTQVLGLRLVKKTVNQDDVSAYHLFYADEVGHPGTDMTFFDWESIAPQQPAAGQISTTAFRVPGRQALAYWAQRFDEYGVPHGEITERAGRMVLSFTDPEGQRLELVDDTATESGSGTQPGIPWQQSPVPVEWGIRGLEGITITARSLAATSRVLTDVLGFRVAGEYSADGHKAVIFEVGPGGPGTEVRIIERTDLPRSLHVGSGGVHHAAFRTPNAEEHAEWRERLTRAGLQATPVIDRYYFRSIYFREPGGVLFEIATDGPGFATDEDVAHLGERLALPPFLEPHRREIEANLKPLASVAPDASQ
jgi:glyoxalase family protein